MPVRTDGPGDFLAALSELGVRDLPDTQLLVDWALWLKRAKLARLMSTFSDGDDLAKGLRIELLGEPTVMAMLWASGRGVGVSLEGAVVRDRVPAAVSAVEHAMAPLTLTRAPAHQTYPVRGGDVVTAELLYALTAAYARAASRGTPQTR